jgi:SAM-dependent methyltransferase
MASFASSNACLEKKIRTKDEGLAELMTGRSSRVNQCQNPTGWLARLVRRNMNSRHSRVTDWGLSQASTGKQDIILDAGCGGGRTVSKLPAIATEGKVYGIDHSTESVAIAMRTNKQWIDIARLEIREASVSRLPFSDGAFDAVTAVETHFWWPALPTDLREVSRVLKPGGRHRELFTDAGYSDVQVIAEPGKGWICRIGSKAPVS